MELKPTDAPASTPEPSSQPSTPATEMACSTEGKCSTACCPISRATRWAVAIVALLVLIQSGALIADYVPLALGGEKSACSMKQVASAGGSCSKPCGSGSTTTAGDSPVIAAVMDCPSLQNANKNAAQSVATLAAADGTAGKPACDQCPLSQVKASTAAPAPDSAPAVQACEASACTKPNDSLAAARLSTSLPEMSYLVAGEPFDCAMAAAMHADKTQKPVEYVVKGKTYASAAHAKVAQLQATEAMLAQYTAAKPYICHSSGKLLSHNVGGLSMSCEKTAAGVAVVAKAAAEGVGMTYMVAGKHLTCPATAAAENERTGAGLYYVVQGETTRCKLTGKLQLARARVLAAAQAAQRAAQQPVNTPKAEPAPAGDTPVSEPAPQPQADPAATRASVAP